MGVVVWVRDVAYSRAPPRLEMGDFRFTRELYLSLCHFCGEGRLKKVKELLESVKKEDRDRFGPSTFCPDPWHDLRSPLSVAAHRGRLHVLHYLLDNYGDIIDINKGAKFVLLDSHAILNRCKDTPPLVAACTQDGVEVVRYLISKGADVSRVCSKLGHCMHAASRYGCVKVLQYLLDLGVGVNTVNQYDGSTPLLVAGERMVEVMELLLSRGANESATDNEGNTVMHHAAALNVDAVRFLYSQGISLEFPCRISNLTKAPPTCVPPPIYRAAAYGNSRAVEYFCSLPECPVLCKVNAKMLLWSYEVDHVGINNHSLLLEAFDLLQESSCVISYPPPVPEYGHYKEVRSVEDVQSLPPPQVHDNCDILIQCLLIREPHLPRNELFALPHIQWFLLHEQACRWRTSPESPAA